MDAVIDDARRVLLDFFQEMYEWELQAWGCLNPDSPGNWCENQRLLLGAIYDRFLTRKERKTGRMAGPHVGASPEFNPDLEKMTSEQVVSAKKVLFFTEKIHPEITDFKEIYRYTVVSKGGELRIDKRELYSAYKEKWVNIVF